MQTKIQRWGNSLGLRIPKSFAAQARVEAGSSVDLILEGGDLIVRPIARPRYDLSSLLKGINARNLHEPVDSGQGVGREVW
jgi:antitoxin MazE